MKHSLAVLAVLTLAAVAVAPASAQSTTLTATIPFDFSAGSRALPAGDYTFGGTWSSTAVLIRNADLSSAGYVLAQAPRAVVGSEAKLIFHRVGEQYFLRQILDGTRGVVRDIPMSSTERELTESAASAKAYETVVILARL
jgi:hypothetical protein